MFIIGKLPEVSRAGSDVWAGTRSRAAAVCSPANLLSSPWALEFFRDQINGPPF